MRPIVYVDILFLLNFFVNTITIYISFILTRRDLKLWRLILSAAFLSLYACIIFFPKISFIYSVFGKTFALGTACLMAYPTKSLLMLAKNTLVLFLSTAVLGGIVFALIFATNFGTAVKSAVSNGEFYLNIDASTLLISIILAYFSVYIIAEIKKAAQIRSHQIFDIKITFQDAEIIIKGFLDTGCTLCEPLSNTPAVIVNQSVADKLFINQNIINKCRVIPYSTIDNQKGFLSGIFPDRVEINGVEIKKCIIAVSKQNLCTDDSFDAIFGTEIYNETNLFERTQAV